MDEVECSTCRWMAMIANGGFREFVLIWWVI